MKKEASVLLPGRPLRIVSDVQQQPNICTIPAGHASQKSINVDRFLPRPSIFKSVRSGRNRRPRGITLPRLQFLTEDGE
jgi:hypothetical protein